MSRSVYRYNVSLCYLCVSLTVSVVSVKRQEVTETAKSVTETSRTYRNFTLAVLYKSRISLFDFELAFWLLCVLPTKTPYGAIFRQSQVTPGARTYEVLLMKA